METKVFVFRDSLGRVLSIVDGRLCITDIFISLSEVYGDCYLTYENVATDMFEIASR